VAGSMSSNSPVVLALSQKTDMSFEKGLAELERIVARLESNEIDLETALADFEQGMKIQQYCKKKLDEATLQVNRLLQDGKLKPLKIFLIIKQRVLNNLLTQMIL
jgi:exodeoxyribonuclease VII small subunit